MLHLGHQGYGPLPSSRITVVSRKSDLYEHRCLENINKLYIYAGKYDNKQQYKAILEAAAVFAPKGLTKNSPMPSDMSMNIKKLLQ